MSEEKKLDKDINVRSKDDTEIDVGMIEGSVEREKYLTVWLVKNSIWKAYSLSKILDLIHRLQSEKNETIQHYTAEIEGLELELSQSLKIITKQKAEIERLTEEVKMGCKYDCHLIDYPDFEREKLVKQKAIKEILQVVDKESNGQTVSVTNVLRKRYGVEVE
jgi:hypothetical protein